MKVGLWLLLFATVTLAKAAPQNGYTDAGSCATCHAKIYQSWQKTGMARSLRRPDAANSIEDFIKNNRYYHRASDTWFEMLRRKGRYYQRRWQIGWGGKETNVDEKPIDFVIGSGSRARTYLYQTASGVLQELPLAWYSEKGGYWAMNPGYDQPDQPNARRKKISYECMFCHNSYPEIPSGHEQLQAEPRFTGTLPEGIDCQRCHGPGLRHVEVARTVGASPQSIRAAIVNPSRLSPERRGRRSVANAIWRRPVFNSRIRSSNTDLGLFSLLGPANRWRISFCISTINPGHLLRHKTTTGFRSSTPCTGFACRNATSEAMEPFNARHAMTRMAVPRPNTTGFAVIATTRHLPRKLPAAATPALRIASAAICRSGVRRM